MLSLPYTLLQPWKPWSGTEVPTSISRPPTPGPLFLGQMGQSSRWMGAGSTLASGWLVLVLRWTLLQTQENSGILVWVYYSEESVTSKVVVADYPR